MREKSMKPVKEAKPKRLSSKINLLISITVAAVILVMVGFTYFESSSLVTQLLADQCADGTKLLQASMVTGAYETDEQRTALLDSLKASTGNEYTIFDGDVRASTTIIVDGERAVGSKLSQEISDIVIGNNKSYVGTADILGTDHLCAYVPYVDASGNVIGVLFSGIASEQLQGQINFAVLLSAITGAVMLIVALVISRLYLRKKLTVPLMSTVAAANNIAQGDFNFTLESSSNDEIGQMADAFSRMREKLTTLNLDIVNVLGRLAGGDWTCKLEHPDIYVGQWEKLRSSIDEMLIRVHDALVQVDAAAGEIAANADQVALGATSLAYGAVAQSESVDKLSVTLGHISERVQQNSGNAKLASGFASESKHVSKSTFAHMNTLSKAMSEISETSDNIGKIVKSIDEIAFQTNILALNAAVEAARAGEAGKGFAVVADEVRNLAQKSAEAAAVTTELIDKTRSLIDAGVQATGDANKSFTDLAKKVNDMTEVVEDISEATSEQATSIVDTTAGIDSISTVVQNNSATSEESAAASQELSNQAGDLRALVARFKL